MLMPREKSCGAVVFKKNREVKYLLLYYEAGHWEFAKGLVEINEGEKTTVMRELKEETGIVDAQFIDVFREKISYFYRREGKTFYKEVVYYLVQVQSSEVKLSYEHVGYEWLDYQSAMERLSFQNAKDMLKKAHEFLKAKGVVS